MLEIILNPGFVVVALWLLAFATPAGALVYTRFFCPPRRRKRLVRRPLIWVLAALGPLVLAMWGLFNAVNSLFGLDSFLALTINLSVFCAVGAALGAILRFLPRQRSNTPPPR